MAIFKVAPWQFPIPEVYFNMSYLVHFTAYTFKIPVPYCTHLCIIIIIIMIIEKKYCHAD